MVYRAGEMRIEAKDEKGRPVTIRTTDDLESFGITTDEQLAAIVAAARASLGIIDGGAIDISPEAGGKPSQALQAIPQAK
jgi:hypothetical protein